VRFDDRDRRRLVFASAVTVAALPAVWLVNRQDVASSTRPNVAAVGPAVDAVAATRTPALVDPMGDVDPQFLRGAGSGPAAPQPVVAVVGPGKGPVAATATAIFRRSIGDRGTCVYSGVPGGSRILVVNVANNRSVSCWTALRPADEPQDEVVMSAAAFGEIADLSSAPIHVEIVHQ